MARTKHAINFVSTKRQQQGWSLYMIIVISLLIVIYGGLASTWLGLVVYHDYIQNATQHNQTYKSMALVRQKHQLLQSLKQWDKQFESQLHLIQLLQWLYHQPYVNNIDYRVGHITIQGRSGSRSNLQRLKQHVINSDVIQSVALKQVHHNSQGQWLFTLRGGDD